LYEFLYAVTCKKELCATLLEFKQKQILANSDR
jgi:hypothetical protein